MSGRAGIRLPALPLREPEYRRLPETHELSFALRSAVTGAARLLASRLRCHRWVRAFELRQSPQQDHASYRGGVGESERHSCHDDRRLAHIREHGAGSAR
jgi:hypothetical protein